MITPQPDHAAAVEAARKRVLAALPYERITTSGAEAFDEWTRLKAEAFSLAREHYRYCPDTVDQGVGSIAALAAMLLDNDWWFFWWD